MAKSIQVGKSAAFKIKGYNSGKEYKGRGIIEEFISTGALVTLTTDDLGGFGTYRKGDTVRIMNSEFVYT